MEPSFFSQIIFSVLLCHKLSGDVHYVQLNLAFVLCSSLFTERKLFNRKTPFLSGIFGLCGNIFKMLFQPGQIVCDSLHFYKQMLKRSVSVLKFFTGLVAQTVPLKFATFNNITVKFCTNFLRHIINFKLRNTCN